MMSHELMSVDEARQLILAGLPALRESEPVELGQIVGRVLAEAVRATDDYPAFANSSMDGFAVKAEDLKDADAARPVELAVIGEVRAGEAPNVQVTPGSAVRIMTGALMPEGANAVTPVEHTDANERSQWAELPEQVRVMRAAEEGAHVRPAGQDLRAGETALEASTRLTARDAGLLAMLGLTRARVYRRPRVALLATGDELVQPGVERGAGQIYESNSPMLAALLEESGAEVIRLGTAADDEGLIRERLDVGIAQGADLLITSAGVSAGSYDFVRVVVESAGALHGWRVNMRPGKPLAFGHYQQVPFLGLPGNPASAFVGYEVFVKPAVRLLGGEKDWQRIRLWATLKEGAESDGRESYLRGSLTATAEGEWQVSLAGHQGSGNLVGLAKMNVLILLPAGVKSIEAGERVEAWPMG